MAKHGKTLVMGEKLKSLIVTDSEVKKAFKVEVTKNGTDMSSVTEILWLKYITMSVDKRKERLEANRAQREATSKTETDER